MPKKTFSNKLLFVTGVCLTLVISSTDAFARGSEDRSHRHGGEVVIAGHDRYHYRDGRFYRPWWFGFEFIVNTPPVGVIVTSLPLGHRTVVVRGTQYYHYNNVYYRSCPSGYVVVSDPATVYTPVVVQPQPLLGETITINVPNSNGSYTPVKLVKRDNGYIGPQGEYYSGNPTIDQLKTLYGK
ncbi:MAG: DUF6515 family protein [Candidatus Omnitrophica bacterium]|nr:DUF6515 family protein [Candidatus Omnitrophota bacterium]